MDDKPVKLILASTSPRRKKLLELSGWEFIIMGADIDETPHTGEPAPAYVLRLAEAKARAVALQTEPQALIVAADTTVADGDAILGKPADAAEAASMLQTLRGRTHQVYTAVAVYHPAERRLLTDLATTDVPMREYSDAEIQAYIATGDPFDKAGAYAIQHPGFKPVEALTGCYANVVGLPLCHLERLLKQFGLTAQHQIPLVCQQDLQYNCSVYPEIQHSPPGAFPAYHKDTRFGVEGEP